jgi:AbrB family looped-hinge helix DNA binding protein
LDKTGRVVLPKAIRDELRLAPGDDLLVETENGRITLSPIHPEPIIKKEHGIWVYQGELPPGSITDLIDEDREKRNRELLG